MARNLTGLRDFCAHFLKPTNHTRGQVFLCPLGFIKCRLETQKVQSTTNASKKIKTNHHESFCKTHRRVSLIALVCWTSQFDF